MDAFLEGADEVFVVSCREGEGHYTDGNMHDAVTFTAAFDDTASSNPVVVNVTTNVSAI